MKNRTETPSQGRQIETALRRLAKLTEVLDEHVHHQRGTGAQQGYIDVRARVAEVAQILGDDS